MILRDKIIFESTEVQSMARQPVPEPADGKLLTVSELATYFAVTDQTIRAWTKDADLQLPYGRFGRYLRFDRNQIQEWVDARWHDGDTAGPPEQ